jgi:hypothetical protein
MHPEYIRIMVPLRNIICGALSAARPFDEPLLLKIASAYTAAARHRVPPSAFGPVAGEP